MKHGLKIEGFSSSKGYSRNKLNLLEELKGKYSLGSLEDGQGKLLAKKPCWIKESCKEIQTSLKGKYF